VDQTVKVAEAAGAAVVAPPFDVMEIGRMAVLSDPTNAFVCLWQPGIHIGAQVVQEDNTLSWNELATKDAARAKEFYTEVFGWDTSEMESPNGTYTMFKIGDEWAGGMMQVQDQPSYWGIYFQVADAAATAAKAKELGGQAMMGPDRFEGVGNIAILLDPQGAVFGIIQPEEQG
jgi:predicted enzyme related to lactoylglutathione lyase